MITWMSGMRARISLSSSRPDTSGSCTWTIDGANRHDVRMLDATLDAVDDAGLLEEIGTLHLDRGYDSGSVRRQLERSGSPTPTSSCGAPRSPVVKKQPLDLGLRWIVEATNTWCSNYGQLRRNTDREHATATPRSASQRPVLIVGRLID